VKEAVCRVPDSPFDGTLTSHARHIMFSTVWNCSVSSAFAKAEWGRHV
jgi:hypothetical protein